MSNLLNPTKLSTQIDNNDYYLETGKIANQAHGSVWIQSGDTVVLVTVVTQPLERDIDFMPLVVDYLEMSYAAGRIPGSYFRREIGRPSERETLVSRLIDRPIRPLFPEGFKQEVQIIATVLSADPDHDPDVLAITGASSALHLSHIPFLGPIAGARIAYVEDNFILDPTQTELEYSQLNLVIAGTENAVVMVEGEAKFASEELITKAISWGHEQIKPLIQLQHKLRETAGKSKMELPEIEEDHELKDLVHQLSYESLKEALDIPEKTKRNERKKQIQDDIIKELSEQFPDNPDKLQFATKYIKEEENEILRSMIKETQTRIDGRDLTSIRNLGIEVGILPRVHGSALFARGETKALGIATLGGSQDEQHVETIAGEQSKRFMLHYNFPPYSVGEVKMLRGPARREIGHGALAEKSLFPILPSTEEFPFTIRIVSEIMESNGSSSMATVCAGSLALMDAGVPIKNPVAGIAMGLIQEEDSYYVLTDILGDEDHFGDMDFKVAGTKEGITGIQMDIKISGVSSEILYDALLQAKQARLNILDQMNKVLEKPRVELPEHAPKLKVIEVDPDRIKDVIGPGGKNIRSITKATGASIDIEDNGKITIFAPNNKSLQDTIEMVLFYDQKPEVGKVYVGKIKNIKDFGAFVEILPGVEGMVHISQLDTKRINNINDLIKIGDEIKVKVTEIEKDTGKVRLSRKSVLLDEQGKSSDYNKNEKPRSEEKKLFEKDNTHKSTKMGKNHSKKQNR